MARKIRFPLKMKNGAEVRTLDELRDNFDLESVLGYFMDGKLLTWLADRYYDDKAEAVSTLTADMPDLNAKLCEILEVEYQPEDDAADLEYIQRRNEKLKILSSVTDDKEILDNIDSVAITQDDLFDILVALPEKVYLYGEKFFIPLGIENICYIGINNPLITLFSDMDFHKEENISFKDVGDIDEYGEDEDYVKTVEWYTKAAEQGYAWAQCILGSMYYDGEGVEEDKNKAVEWYKKAVEQGYARASYELGEMYRYGYGEEEDISKAVEWYTKAAEQGYARASYKLGEMYYDGYDVEEDHAKAVEWFTKAAEQGYVDALKELGNMYYIGIHVKKDYTKAAEWYTKAAEKGDVDAQSDLGDVYYAEQDYTKAVEWYRKAAEQGDFCAQNDLGNMYYNGQGVEQDYAKAVEWYRKAAEWGNDSAKSHLKELGVWL